MFEVHPDAIRSFNAQVEEIADLVVLRPPRQQPTPAFMPEIHLSGHITSEDIIGPVQLSESDLYGNEMARFRECAGGVYGLEEEPFARLRELAPRIQKLECWQDSLSVKFVEDILFQWCLDKTQGMHAEMPMEKLANEAAKQVKTIEFWIPVYDLHTQQEIRFGSVRFATITRAMIDKWDNKLQSHPDFPPEAVPVLTARRKELQGYAAVVVQIMAEPKRAREVATELADDAIGLLRFFCPANLDVNLTSQCVARGKEHHQGFRLLQVSDGAITEDSKGVNRKGIYPWVIDARSQRELKAAGLDFVGEVFGKVRRTKLETDVLDAMLLFSSGCLVPHTAERLLYVFAALESLLLLNESEPITQAIGERLGFLAGQDADSRIAINRRVKDAYKVRSAFVHHGKRLNSSELNLFLIDAWNGVHTVLLNTQRHRTKESLIQSIERHKYR
jgi:hypothetical protein